MFKSHSQISIIAHIASALLFGFGLAYLSWGGISVVGNKIAGLGSKIVVSAIDARTLIYENVAISQSQSAATNVSAGNLLYIEDEKIDIPSEGKLIAANLGLKQVTLYQNGQVAGTYPIKTIGKPGEAWETPRGLYRVETKERNHFSSIGQVYMPYSMQFNGNYFIHGETYYPDGTPVSASFSGGCIKMKTVDAAEIYAFVDAGTPVYVFGGQVSSGEKQGGYLKKFDVKIPDVSAASYLIADIDSGEILTERELNAVRPAGRLSQLVSALVTLDAINFFNQASVKLNGLNELPAATLLLPGEKLVVKDLLYPMLFGDTGAAAGTLSSVMGQDIFVSKMNKRADSIGLKQSVFFDATGLSTNNVSSATDLFKLARHISHFKNYIWELTRESEKVSGRHLWRNQNGLSDLPGFRGGIVGTVNGAGQNGVALLAIPGVATSTRQVAIVVMGSDNAKQDISALNDYVRTGFTYEKEITAQTKRVAVPVSVSSTTETSLAFVGDIMLDRGVEQLVMKYGASDFNFPFADVAEINGADILFGNLEGPVSDKGRDLHNLYSFRMSPAVVQALSGQGFDVLSVANNHVGDWTGTAFADTFTKFQNSNIALIGGGLNKTQAAELKIIEKNGVKFGYLGFSDVGPNGLRAGTSTAGILIAGDSDTPDIIKRASEKCDVLIVSFHFGNEYESHSNWRQRELAHMAVDNGARIVVGHHPHTPQETESYRGGVIMYSLGNFIFDQSFSTDTMSGLAVKITFDGKNISKVEEHKTVIDELFRVKVE